MLFCPSCKRHSQDTEDGRTLFTLTLLSTVLTLAEAGWSLLHMAQSLYMRPGYERAEHLQNKTTAYPYGFPLPPVQHTQTSITTVEAVAFVQSPLEVMEKGASVAPTLAVLCSDTCGLGRTSIRCNNCAAALLPIQLLMDLKVFIATFKILIIFKKQMRLKKY